MSVNVKHCRPADAVMLLLSADDDDDDAATARRSLLVVADTMKLEYRNLISDKAK